MLSMQGSDLDSVIGKDYDLDEYSDMSKDQDIIDQLNKQGSI